MQYSHVRLCYAFIDQFSSLNVGEGGFLGLMHDVLAQPMWVTPIFLESSRL